MCTEIELLAGNFLVGLANNYVKTNYINDTKDIKFDLVSDDYPLLNPHGISRASHDISTLNIFSLGISTYGCCDDDEYENETNTSVNDDDGTKYRLFKNGKLVSFETINKE